MKPSTVLTKAALKTVTARKAATKRVKSKVSKKQMAKAASESPLAAANAVGMEITTTIQEQEHSQPPITTELVVEAATLATMHLHNCQVGLVSVEPTARRFS